MVGTAVSRLLRPSHQTNAPPAISPIKANHHQEKLLVSDCAGARSGAGPGSLRAGSVSLRAGWVVSPNGSAFGGGSAAVGSALAGSGLGAVTRGETGRCSLPTGRATGAGGGDAVWRGGKTDGSSRGTGRGTRSVVGVGSLSTNGRVGRTTGASPSTGPCTSGFCSGEGGNWKSCTD